MSERIDREIIGGHLLVIGGAEDKYNERRILKKFLELAGEKSDVLIVPVASDFPEFAADVYTQAFRNLGVANPRVLRATSRQDVFQADSFKLAFITAVESPAIILNSGADPIAVAGYGNIKCAGSGMLDHVVHTLLYYTVQYGFHVAVEAFVKAFGVYVNL